MHLDPVRARKLGPLFFLLVASGLAVSVSLEEGCTTTQNGSPLGNENDAAPSTDANTPVADSAGPTPSDGGPDAAPTCTRHAPAGFTQVVASNGPAAVLTGAATGRAQAMVLDENDDPMIAYASVDSSTSWSINFTRWDACTGQFTTPIVVDELHPAVQPDVALAYDPSTKEIGIAYGKGGTDNNWADSYGLIWLGTMKAPATSFTVEPLSVAYDDYLSAGGPSIAMGGGRIYVAYWQGPYPSDDSDQSGYVWLLSSTAAKSTPPFTGPTPALDGGVVDAAPAPDDAGDDAGDAGTPPPHYFAYEAVPFAQGVGGFVFPQEGSGTVGVAIDSNGVPGVAAYEGDLNYGKRLVFWRANTPGAVLVHGFTLDDSVDVSLVFEGTKARIAGHIEMPTEDDASAIAPDSLAFIESNDGITWSTPVHLPNNESSQNTAFSSALAIDGLGHAAVASNINGGVGNGMACGSNPYVALSSDEDDGGALWTACGADTNDSYGYTAGSVSAAYGASRANGTLSVSFVTNAGAVGDAGAPDQAGIVYWQHP